MTSFTLQVHDKLVRDALSRLQARLEQAQPVLESIGEHSVERIKRRFETSSAPDGTPWKPNSQSTLDQVASRLGKSFRKKGGALNAKGQARVTGKKPLIGESRALSTQIVRFTSQDSLTVASTPIYAAIQHLGGQAGRGGKVTIPARPFMPIMPDGQLYPEERDAILLDLNNYLADLV